MIKNVQENPNTLIDYFLTIGLNPSLPENSIDQQQYLVDLQIIILPEKHEPNIIPESENEQLYFHYFILKKHRIDLDGKKRIYLKCIYGNLSSNLAITEINFYRIPTKTHKEVIKAATDEIEPVPIGFYPNPAEFKIENRTGRKSQKKVLIYFGNFELSDELFKTEKDPKTCLVFFKLKKHKNSAWDIKEGKLAHQ